MLSASMFESAQAANLPGGNACYDWGYGDKTLLGAQYWAPSDMKVTFASTDIPNEKKMHIEFSFDADPALYKGWGLRSIMNGKMYYYPFGLEIKLVLPSTSGVHWTGDERGTDWRSWSSGASVGESGQPGVYLDTQLGDSVPVISNPENRLIGFGIVQPFRLKKDVQYHFEIRLNVPPNADVTGTHVISTLRIDMVTAGLLRWDPYLLRADRKAPGSPGDIFGSENIGTPWGVVYSFPSSFAWSYQYVNIDGAGELVYLSNPQAATYGTFGLKDQAVGGVEYKFTTYPIGNINSLSGSYEYRR